MRDFDEPLEVGAKIVEFERRYRVTEVAPPTRPALVGRAWVEPDGPAAA